MPRIDDLFIDDILVASSSFDEHPNHLRQVLDRLRYSHLQLKWVKCKFASKRVTFLVYDLEGGQIFPLASRVEKLQNISPPRDLKELRTFLEAMGYCKRFIPNYADIAKPLTDLTKEKIPFLWTAREQQAFERLKNALVASTALSHVEMDPESQFILETDASGCGLGVVLYQKIKDGLRILAFQSKTLSPAEKNYFTIENEGLGVVWAIKTFSATLAISSKLILVKTDHRPLTAIMKLWLNDPPNARIARWMEILRPLVLEIVHKLGKENALADALSRVSAIRLIPKHPFGETELVIAQSADEFGTELSGLGLTLLDGLWYLEDKGSLRLYVPSKLRSQLVLEAHTGRSGCHYRWSVIDGLLRKDFFWPGMSKEICSLVSSCEVCPGQRGVPFLAPIWVSRPGVILAVDITYLSKSREGKRYVSM